MKTNGQIYFETLHGWQNLTDAEKQEWEDASHDTPGVVVGTARMIAKQLGVDDTLSPRQMGRILSKLPGTIARIRDGNKIYRVSQADVEAFLAL